MKVNYTISLLTLFILTSCSSAPAYNDPIPAHKTFILNSKHLNENRVINVWTPSEYQLSNDSLPVLYMPDGGIKEDFPHIANTLAALIKAKK